VRQTGARISSTAIHLATGKNVLLHQALNALAINLPTENSGMIMPLTSSWPGLYRFYPHEPRRGLGISALLRSLNAERRIPCYHPRG